MKILQVGSALNAWGGIERYVVYLGSGLERRGHEVQLTRRPDTPLANRWKGAAIDLASRGKTDFHAFQSYLRLFRMERFDVIHIHFSPDLLVAATAARIAKAGKVVMTRHVAEPWGRPKAAIYMRLIDHVIPVSNAVQKVLAGSGVPDSRMTVAKAGTPPLIPIKGREVVRRSLGIQGFTFGVFGRLAAEKGVDLAIRASGQFKAPLHVFGDGPEFFTLQKLADGLSAPVAFHGFQQEVADAMNAVDTVLIPSRWAEAFPFSALEAMSLAKPIIAADTGGLPEMVQDGTTGLLFKRDDFNDLAIKMKRLTARAAEAETMGCRGQERHQREFTVEQMAERIEKVYEKALSGP